MNLQEAIDAPMWRSYFLSVSKAPFVTNSEELIINDCVFLKTVEQLAEMGWNLTVVKEFSNNPECIIMKGKKDSTLTGVVTSNKANSIIAR